MATSTIKNPAKRTWTLIANQIDSTEISIDVSAYSEVLMILYNTSNYLINSTVYPVSLLNGHVVNAYGTSSDYYVRIKENGTKAVASTGGGVFKGIIYAR